MPRTLGRTEYCRKQAAECAAAATASALPDVKEAYLNLEQAWLQLAPELEGGLNVSTGPEPRKSDRTPKSGKARS